jgi:tRNA threonylcarbamoyladenosine biosynthesis protein TsaE
LVKYPSKVLVKDISETRRLASDFILEINKGEKIVLNGELGSGKTFFIKSALGSIGIENVNSPSFAIVNEYYGKQRFFHFDFYRLKNIVELFDIGWQDYLNDDDAVMFIEWGNLIHEALPNKRIEINIETKKGTNREFNFAKFD